MVDDDVRLSSTFAATSVTPPLVALACLALAGCASPETTSSTSASPVNVEPSRPTLADSASAASASSGVAPSASASVAVAPPERCYPPSDGGPRDDGFRTPGWPIVHASLSPDGCNLAVANSMGEMLYMDVASAKVLARVRPVGSERSLPAAFIDGTRIAFCGDTDALHLWDGRSPPVDIAKLPMPAPMGCRGILVDPRSERIAVLASADPYSESKTLVVYDYAGKILGERKGVSGSYASLSGDWYTYFGSPKRRFVNWSDPAAEPVSAWPPGVVFGDDLGPGPIGFRGRPPDPIGLEDDSSEAAENPKIPFDQGIPYLGTFSPDGKYAAIFYREDKGAKPRSRTGLFLFDAAFKAELAFTPISWASDFIWIHGGETLAYLYSLDVKFIDVPSGRPHGAITTGKN